METQEIIFSVQTKCYLCLFHTKTVYKDIYTVCGLEHEGILVPVTFHLCTDWVRGLVNNICILRISNTNSEIVQVALMFSFKHSTR